MKGFPGLLNTIGTLLDRSRTILQKVKKCQKWGPHGPQKGPWARAPGTLGPKNKELIKIDCFLLYRKQNAHKLISKLGEIKLRGCNN